VTGDETTNAPLQSRYWKRKLRRTVWLVSLGSGDNLDLVDGFWTVPSNPSDNGALIYLFNGIEPSNFSAILQPVLQYGSNGAFGGNYWVIASWYVGNSGFHSG